MKKVDSMRPQDILVLLKIICIGDNAWRTTDLAEQLFMSQSEISQSLHRNKFAGLLGDSKRNVFRESFFEFLAHGIKYVFPQRPGGISRGMPTSHSAPPLSGMVHENSTIFVWPDEGGTVRGESIIPLYPSVPKAAKIDGNFYELAALVDAVRVGTSREYSLAVAELRKRILGKG